MKKAKVRYANKFLCLLLERRELPKSTHLLALISLVMHNSFNTTHFRTWLWMVQTLFDLSFINKTKYSLIYYITIANLDIIIPIIIIQDLNYTKYRLEENFIIMRVVCFFTKILNKLRAVALQNLKVQHIANYEI